MGSTAGEALGIQRSEFKLMREGGTLINLYIGIGGSYSEIPRRPLKSEAARKCMQ